MGRHRRSGIGAGIEGWMKADMPERELLLRQKRQEASIQHEQQALGFDERRVRLAEQAGERAELGFPSLLREQEAGATSAEIGVEEQRRIEDLEKRLDAYEAATAGKVSPTLAGAPAGAASRLEKIVGFEERAGILEETQARREAEKAEELPSLRAGAEAGRAQVDIATTEALREQEIPAGEAVTLKAEQKARREVAEFTPEKMEADLEAIRSGTALRVAEEKRTRLLMPEEAELLRAKVLAAKADEVEEDVLRKYIEGMGLDYDKFRGMSAMADAGMVMTVKELSTEKRQALNTIALIDAKPTMDDPAIQKILAENPMMAFFMGPTADKATAKAGLQQYVRMLDKMLGEWGVRPDEIIAPSAEERSAAVDELRSSRQ